MCQFFSRSGHNGCRGEKKTSLKTTLLNDCSINFAFHRHIPKTRQSSKLLTNLKGGDGADFTASAVRRGCFTSGWIHLILLVFEIFHHGSGLLLLAVLGSYRRTTITAVLLSMSDLILSRAEISKIKTITFFRFEFTSSDLMTSLLSVAIKDEITGVSLRMVCVRSLGGARGN